MELEEILKPRAFQQDGDGAVKDVVRKPGKGIPQKPGQLKAIHHVKYFWDKEKHDYIY